MRDRSIQSEYIRNADITPNLEDICNELSEIMNLTYEKEKRI